MNFIGKEIDDFKVNAFQDGDVKQVTKKDLLGHWSIVFFYPADFSFVCPTELGDLADNYEDFKKAGAEIYSVSEDTEFVHQAWHEQSEEVGKVQYPMIADPAGKLARFLRFLMKMPAKLTVACSLLIQKVKFVHTPLMIWELAVMPKKSCEPCKPLNLSPNMVMGMPSQLAAR